MKQAELEVTEKLDYVETQLDEMQRIAWRNEVDIYINENTNWGENEQPEVDVKVRQLKKQNETLAKAIVALGKLKKTLQ